MPSSVRWKFSRRLRKGEQGKFAHTSEKVHANGAGIPRRSHRLGVAPGYERCDAM